MDNLETTATNGFLHLDDVLGEQIDSPLEASLLDDGDTDVIEPIIAETIKKPKTFVSNGKEGTNSLNKGEEDIDILLSRIDTYVDDLNDVPQANDDTKTTDKNTQNSKAADSEYPYNTQELVNLLEAQEESSDPSQTTIGQQNNLEKLKNAEITESNKIEKEHVNSELNGILCDQLPTVNIKENEGLQLEKVIINKAEEKDVSLDKVDSRKNNTVSVQGEYLISTQEILTLVDLAEREEIESKSEESTAITEVETTVFTPFSNTKFESHLNEKSILNEDSSYKDINNLTKDNSNTDSECVGLKETPFTDASVPMECSVENKKSTESIVDPLQGISKSTNIRSVNPVVDYLDENCDTSDRTQEDNTISLNANVEKDSKVCNSEQKEHKGIASKLTNVSNEIDEKTGGKDKLDTETKSSCMVEDEQATADSDIIEIFDDSPVKVSCAIEEVEVVDQDSSPHSVSKSDEDKSNIDEPHNETVGDVLKAIERPETLLKNLHKEVSSSTSSNTMGSKQAKNEDTSNLISTLEEYNSDDDILIIDHSKAIAQKCKDEIGQIEQNTSDGDQSNKIKKEKTKSDVIKENGTVEDSKEDPLSATENTNDELVSQSVEPETENSLIENHNKDNESHGTILDKNQTHEENSNSTNNDAILLLDDEDTDDRLALKTNKIESDELNSPTDSNTLTSNDAQSHSECLKAVELTENISIETEPAEEVSPPLVDDAIVLLDDDEEENVSQQKDEDKMPECTTKTSIIKSSLHEISIEKTPNEIEKEIASPPVTDDSNKEHINEETNNDLIPDTSDNACDALQVNEKVVNDGETSSAKTIENDDGVSNCSSSSNLLQESQVQSRDQEEAADEDEDGDDNDDDVQFVEDSVEGAESVKDSNSELAPPPSKKIRLSVDAPQSSQTERDIEISVESTRVGNETTEKEVHKIEQNGKVDGGSLPTKRPHSSIEEPGSEKSDNDMNNGSPKKSKISNSVNEIDKDQVETKNVSKSDDDKTALETIVILDDVPKEDKADLKFAPVVAMETEGPEKPITLYPPPKLMDNFEPLNIEILKQFKKNFRHMNKHDLEQLILQKIVEVIIFKSEFSTMTEKMEKMEKIIYAQRTKIEEVSKQFRDLEMVHNRVIKELEARNSNTVLPVKITRAVGLQVSFPYRSVGDISAPSVNSVNSSAPTSFRNFLSKNTSARATSTENTPPQSNSLSAQTVPTAALAGNQNAAARRGVLQKSPSRVDPSTNLAPSAAPSGVGQIQVRSSAQLMPVPAGGPPSSGRGQKAVLTPPIPAVFVGRSKSSQQDMPRTHAPSSIAQLPRMQGRQTGQPLRRMNPRMSNGSTVAQQQQQALVTQSQSRRADPLPQLPTVNFKPLPNSVQQYPVSQSVSITTARPKVIDLTEEDETSTSVAASVNTGRRNVTGQNFSTASNSNSSGYMTNRPTPPLLRYGSLQNPVNPSVSGIPTIRKIAPTSVQKIPNFNNNSAIPSITTPAGTSITRVQVSTANPTTPLQRTRNVHPAPLPVTPSQPHNSGWKLPPQRPHIRISNVDKGIVISWTLEEPTTTRHADCVSYQIYAYQETNTQASTDMWRCVGDVKAMLLPMAVTLTQFQEGQRYYFAVRAVDAYNRVGPFSLPKTWA